MCYGVHTLQKAPDGHFEELPPPGRGLLQPEVLHILEPLLHGQLDAPLACLPRLAPVQGRGILCKSFKVAPLCASGNKCFTGNGALLQHDFNLAFYLPIASK